MWQVVVCYVKHLSSRDWTSELKKTFLTISEKENGWIRINLQIRETVSLEELIKNSWDWRWETQHANGEIKAGQMCDDGNVVDGVYGMKIGVGQNGQGDTIERLYRIMWIVWENVGRRCVVNTRVCAP